MNKQTIQAIKDSIVHWEQDIRKPFKRGFYIKEDRYCVDRWHFLGLQLKKVRYYNIDCALCEMFRCGKDYSRTLILECPLQKIGRCCYDDNSPYGKFRDNPCVETAEAMIETLKSLLPEGK